MIYKILLEAQEEICHFITFFLKEFFRFKLFAERLKFVTKTYLMTLRFH